MVNGTLTKPVVEMIEVEKVPGKVTLELTIEEAHQLKFMLGEMHSDRALITKTYDVLRDMIGYNRDFAGHFVNQDNESIDVPRWVPVPANESIWD